MLNDKQRKLVEDNLNCIYAAVWKYCKNPEEDIFQDAVVAVCRALPRFDPEKAEFTTWVYAVVRFMLRKKSEYNHRSMRTKMKTVSFYAHSEDSGEDEWDTSESFGIEEKGFEEVDSAIDCEKFFQRLKMSKISLNKTESQLLDKLIESNGHASPTALAKDFNCTKQNIYSARKRMQHKLAGSKKYLL